MTKDRPIRAVRADWRDIVLVCRKCSKKLDGRGFGADGRQSLAKCLRQATSGETKAKVKPRKARLAVIEVDCLKVCPKNAVMAVNAGAPQDWAIIPAGTPVQHILDRLGLSRQDLSRPGLSRPDRSDPTEPVAL